MERCLEGTGKRGLVTLKLKRSKGNARWQKQVNKHPQLSRLGRRAVTRHIARDHVGVTLVGFVVGDHHGTILGSSNPICLLDAVPTDLTLPV